MLDNRKSAKSLVVSPKIFHNNEATNIFKQQIVNFCRICSDYNENGPIHYLIYKLSLYDESTIIQLCQMQVIIIIFLNEQ